MINECRDRADIDEGVSTDSGSGLSGLSSSSSVCGDTVTVGRKSKRLCVVRIGKLCCERFYLRGTFRHFSACESSFFGNEALNKNLEFQIDLKTVQ